MTSMRFMKPNIWTRHPKEHTPHAELRIPDRRWICRLHHVRVVRIPVGPIVKYPEPSKLVAPHGTGMSHSEYIVYDESQVIIRFLVQVSASLKKAASG